MSIFRWGLILGALICSGCATPATTFMLLDYKQQVGTAKVAKTAIEKYSVSNELFSLSADKMAASIQKVVGKSSPPGSGISRPAVKKKDPWSIVLARAHLADPRKGWFDGAPNVAVLLRINTGDGSDIDGKWVLAAANESVTVPSDLNFDNLLVWSGITDKAITIDVEFVKLNKADKEKMAGYLSLTSLVSTAIPQYGAIAKAIVSAGEAINTARSDYTVLLSYRAGFHTEKSLQYAVYALLPQEVANTQGKDLWYDLNFPDTDQIKDGSSRLAANWCAFRIIKGSSRTFDYGKADSLEKVKKLADDWVSINNPTKSYSDIKTALGGIVSSLEAKRITGKIEFNNKNSIVEALRQVKKRQSDPDKTLHLNDSDYSRLLQVIESYLPDDLIPSADSNIDVWIKNSEKLAKGYHYDAEQDKWVKDQEG